MKVEALSLSFFETVHHNFVSGSEGLILLRLQMTRISKYHSILLGIALLYIVLEFLTSSQKRSIFIGICQHIIAINNSDSHIEVDLITSGSSGAFGSLFVVCCLLFIQETFDTLLKFVDPRFSSERGSSYKPSTKPRKGSELPGFQYASEIVGPTLGLSAMYPSLFIKNSRV